MSKSEVQMLAGMRRAELLGYRLAQQIEADAEYEAAVEAELQTGFTLAEVMEAMYPGLERLDADNIPAVARFLATHFDAELDGMDSEQRAACAQAFSCQIGLDEEQQEAVEA